ncbi:probable F-box protein At4g22030 [Ricinus communis]|uniref:probable F-box protein At4g22030 n=1 Tax=Ricinus communis TaxID=3988 RepID=UPI00201A3671|nr:probable F-box protein At4g22030 [Ricinus communis]
MATIQASCKLFSSSSSSSSCSRRFMIKSNIFVPQVRINAPLHHLPKLSTRGLMEELERRNGYREMGSPMEKDSRSWINTNISTLKSSEPSDPMVIAKLYAIMEAVADRVEMHENIGKQRDNWNHLLLTSINTITLTAATMCGLASGAPQSAFKISSTILYLAAAGMLTIMNAIQPSQLAEEQRNASRLFKQLAGQIHTTLSIGNPTMNDVKQAMENVLALDRAFPLPLLGAMLEKFPSTVKPAVWWPRQEQRQPKKHRDGNGWNKELEDEMREIVGVLKRKDKADYSRLGEVALKINKIMAISGPLLTSLAAIGSAFAGSNPWAAIVGVGCGALASIVNAIEHGGQVGMVFEMYRGNVGFFKLMEETIESNINERDVRRRENGEMLEMKVALQLGRSLSELRNLAASTSPRNEETAEEFGSKLF